MKAGPTEEAQSGRVDCPEKAKFLPFHRMDKRHPRVENPRAVHAGMVGAPRERKGCSLGSTSRPTYPLPDVDTGGSAPRESSPPDMTSDPGPAPSTSACGSPESPGSRMRSQLEGTERRRVRLRHGGPRPCLSLGEEGRRTSSPCGRSTAAVTTCWTPGCSVRRHVHDREGSPPRSARHRPGVARRRPTRRSTWWTCGPSSGRRRRAGPGRQHVRDAGAATARAPRRHPRPALGHQVHRRPRRRHRRGRGHDSEWAARLRRVRAITGGLLHPLGAYLLHRGLQTLPVRVRAQQETARVLAERISAYDAVARVFYPGLQGQDPKGLLGRQLDGPGSIIAVELAGGYDAAARFTELVRAHRVRRLARRHRLARAASRLAHASTRSPGPRSRAPESCASRSASSTSTTSPTT